MADTGEKEVIACPKCNSSRFIAGRHYDICTACGALYDIKTKKGT